MSKPALILLVDDEADFLELTRQLLELHGYRVACARDPVEARECLEAEKPDLIVTDLMMETPDSGLALARELRQDPRLLDVPLVILTAVAGRRFGVRARGGEELADAYMEKPVAPETLLGKICELLNRPK